MPDPSLILGPACFLYATRIDAYFIHTIFYYDDYLIIIMNGGKGLVTAENIPLKSIDNSLIIDIPGTFSGSYVYQQAPPNIDSFRQKTVDFLFIDRFYLAFCT